MESRQVLSNMADVKRLYNSYWAASLLTMMHYGDFGLFASLFTQNLENVTTRCDLAKSVVGWSCDVWKGFTNKFCNYSLGSDLTLK